MRSSRMRWTSLASGWLNPVPVADEPKDPKPGTRKPSGAKRTGSETPAPPPPPPPETAPAPPVYKERKWIPTIAILVIAAVFTMGGYIVAGALERTEDVAPIAIGPLTVFPPDGWEAVEELTAPTTGLRLAYGSGFVDIFVGGYDGDPLGLYEFYIAFLAESAAPDPDREAKQFRYQPQPDQVTGLSGTQGVRGFYIGTYEGLSAPIEGEVFAFTTGGLGIVFDGWGSEGQYSSVAEDVRQMVETGEVASQ